MDDKLQPYYRLYMIGTSLIIIVLSGLAVWGLNKFVDNQEQTDATLAASDKSIATSVAELSASVNLHVQADIKERGIISDRIASDEARIGRLEQNHEDTLLTIQRSSATREQQLGNLADSISKLAETLAQTRSDVAEIKGRLEVAMPNVREGGYRGATH